jgi:hypothetical protein
VSAAAAAGAKARSRSAPKHHDGLLAWPSLLVFVVLTVLYIPIKRYVVAGHLPFALEPYRIVLALVLVGWLGSLLVDRRVRISATGLEAPFALLLLATVGSIVSNPARSSQLGAEVIKALTFFISFILLVYLVASLLRKDDHVDRVLRALVGGGAVLSMFAVYEHWTGSNVFGRLAGWIPMLVQPDGNWSLAHDYHGRAYASAQHPIALGAALALILPLTAYLYKTTGRRRWLGAALLLFLGVLASGSRTAIIMLVVIALTFVCLKPRQTRRLWPLLIPMVFLVHFALPSTLGSLRQSFMPSAGLIAQQSTGAGTRGSGRLADLGPSLSDSARHPMFGVGFGTRITDRGATQNAVILDDEWLSTLLEIGYIGLAAWVWVFWRFVRVMGRAARAEPTTRSWLFVGLAAGVAGFAVGMLTYDAFSFIQVTFLLYLLLGIGAAAARSRRPRRVAL